MDAYPPDYIFHNLPLVILSGLGSADNRPQHGSIASYPLLDEKGLRITSALLPVTGSSAEQLLRTFLEADASKGCWNGRSDREKTGTMGFRVKEVGREYKLPPRKANPPPTLSSPSPSSPSPPPSPNVAPVLHSPLSPLSPGSPIFPDGVMTPQWLNKHQELLPSVFVSFFTFTSDPNISSLQDNQLKATINQIRSVFSSSSYKTRFVAVLCSEKSILDADVDQRLNNIRRATGLDSKSSLFFFPPNLSTVETRAFVQTTLAALQPVCVEYYRELSKHARRKRNRGSIPAPTAPPTSGTSQTLPSQGWNVRYEFKLGVLAEFRQEMDAAGRNYENAYESLMSQDVSETIASWSPRFNEARLLADVTAIRILRCLLWNGQTTSAVQSWANHKTRMQDFIDRKGNGSASYGWEAWEARWYSVMAEVVGKADIPIFSIPDPSGLSSTETNKVVEIYAPPERAIAIGERLLPWELLHHGGYWINQSIRHTVARRKLAQDIPEEDRASPGQSPASHVASRSYMYDTYLCPEPHVESPLPGRKGFDHSKVILKCYASSLDQFCRRGQGRAVEHVKLQIAREHMQQESWHDAFRILMALWHDISWRRAGWWNLVEELAWTLRDCAWHVGDGACLVAVDWELMSNKFTPLPNWAYDISKSLDGLNSTASKPVVILRADEVVSFLSVKFAFSRVEGNVGEPLQYQVAVASQAQKGAAPVELSVIRIAFEGVLEAVKLQNQVKPEKVPSKTADTVQVQDIELHETSSSEDLSSGSSSPTSESKAGLVGSADLSFSPGQMKIFKLTSIPRESGVTRAVSCTLFMEEKLFSLEYIVPLDDDRMSSSWWTRRKPGFAERSLGHEQLTSFKILPKPPKLEIQLRNVNSEYYTDESVILDIEIINNEDEQADAAIEVRLLGQFDGTPELSWGPTSPESHEVCPSSPNVGGSQTTHLSRRAIGGLAQAAKATEVVAFRAKSQPAEYVLEIRILYHLVSDPNTPLSKTLTTDIVLVSPFEANYDFTPRVYLDQWPSLFQVEDNRAPDKLDNKLASLADGITQRWCLSAGVASFAAESLTIEAMDVLVLGMNGGVTATITPEEQNGCSNLAIGSREQKEVRFTLDAQKLILEDRRSASLDLALNIRWRRPSQASELNTTSLSVPRLLIPAGEPRVLASLRYQVSGLPALVYVDYTFENPSMHFLTFNLAMEASEDFAFSGPKTTSLQMVPLSRHTIRYTLLPYVRGAWIQPQLKVVDMYFNKLLRISPTAGLKVDKKGLLIWVDTDA